MNLLGWGPESSHTLFSQDLNRANLDTRDTNNRTGGLRLDLDFKDLFGLRISGIMGKLSLSQSRGLVDWIWVLRMGSGSGVISSAWVATVWISRTCMSWVDLDFGFCSGRCKDLWQQNWISRIVSGFQGLDLGFMIWIWIWEVSLARGARVWISRTWFATGTVTMKTPAALVEVAVADQPWIYGLYILRNLLGVGLGLTNGIWISRIGYGVNK